MLKNMTQFTQLCACSFLLFACATPNQTAAQNSTPEQYAQQGGYPSQVTSRPYGDEPGYVAPGAYDRNGTYNDSEIVSAISTHLGVTSESAATAIERLFKDQGRPVGYITGEEGGGAITIGAKYGKGTLWMKNGDTRKVYWQGPSIGFDAGADASKVFTLVYNLQDPDYIYQRFPGVDGSAYLVAGMAVNYQRANGIVLAPIRTGVGLRLGANIGYRSYTRNRSIIPF